MKLGEINKPYLSAVFFVLLLVTAVQSAVFAQEAGTKPTFKQEELDQMLAPIALYPDSLLTQILMASTYPLEIVQADRWQRRTRTSREMRWPRPLKPSRGTPVSSPW